MPNFDPAQDLPGDQVPITTPVVGLPNQFGGQPVGVPTSPDPTAVNPNPALNNTSVSVGPPLAPIVPPMAPQGAPAPAPAPGPTDASQAPSAPPPVTIPLIPGHGRTPPAPPQTPPDIAQ